MNTITASELKKHIKDIEERDTLIAQIQELTNKLNILEERLPEFLKTKSDTEPKDKKEKAKGRGKPSKLENSIKAALRTAKEDGLTADELAKVLPNTTAEQIREFWATTGQFIPKRLLKNDATGKYTLPIVLTFK